MSKAKLYDGLSTKTHNINIKFDRDKIILLKNNISCIQNLDEIKISKRVGNTPRYIYFNDITKCETNDNERVDQFLKTNKLQSSSRLINKIKSRSSFVILSLVLIVFLSFISIKYLIPKTSYILASLTPYETKYKLSKKTLEHMQHNYIFDTRLGKSKTESINEQFINLLEILKLDKAKYKLHFRSGDLGANAFTLPSGDIVITDDLVKLAKNDKEIMAVLLHEIGHVEYNHGFQSIYSNTSLYLFLSFLTADISQLTIISATLPTFLLKNKYSREFEYEADDFFTKNSKKVNIDKEHFRNILTRLAKDENRIFSYIGTHPSTKDRVKKVE